MELRIVDPTAPTLPEAFGLDPVFCNEMVPLINKALQEEITSPQQWSAIIAGLAVPCRTNEELVWVLTIFADCKATCCTNISLI